MSRKKEEYVMTEKGEKYMLDNIKVQENERLMYGDCLNNMGVILE